MTDYKCQEVSNIVFCVMCNSKNVYGEFNRKTPSNPALDFMLIHCYECGLMATRGVGNGTSVQLATAKGVCGHGVLPSGNELGQSQCHICNKLVDIASVEVGQ